MLIARYGTDLHASRFVQVFRIAVGYFNQKPPKTIETMRAVRRVRWVRATGKRVNQRYIQQETSSVTVANPYLGELLNGNLGVHAGLPLNYLGATC